MKVWHKIWDIVCIKVGVFRYWEINPIFCVNMPFLKPSDLLCLHTNHWQRKCSGGEEIWRECWWRACSSSCCSFSMCHSGGTKLSGKLLWHLTGSDSIKAADRTNTDCTQRMLLTGRSEKACVQDKLKDNKQTLACTGCCCGHLPGQRSLIWIQAKLTYPYNKVHHRGSVCCCGHVYSFSCSQGMK